MSYEDYDDDDYAPSRRGSRRSPKKRGTGQRPRDDVPPSREPRGEKIKRRGGRGPGPLMDDDEEDYGRRRGRPPYEEKGAPPRSRRPPRGDRRPRESYEAQEIEYEPSPRRPPRGPPAYDERDPEPRGRRGPPDHDDMYGEPSGRRGPPPSDMYGREPRSDSDMDYLDVPSEDYPMEPREESRPSRGRTPPSSYTSLDVPMEKARRSRQTAFLAIGLCIIVIVTFFTLSYLSFGSDPDPNASLKHRFEVKGFIGETPIEIETTLNSGTGTFLLVDDNTFDTYENDPISLKNNNVSIRENTRSAKFNIDLEPGTYYVVVQDTDGDPTNMNFALDQYPIRPLLWYMVAIFGIIAVIFGIRAALLTQRMSNLTSEMKREASTKKRQEYDDLYGDEPGRRGPPGRGRRSDSRGKPPVHTDYEGWGRPQDNGRQTFRNRQR